MKGIVHCLDLDLWVGDGGAEDQALEAVAARYRCWSAVVPGSLTALISTSGLAMEARKTRVDDGIVHCLDLDLQIGRTDSCTGCACWSEVREGVARCLDLDLRVSCACCACCITSACCA